jgi:Domain of unknown function (DUF4157)
VDPLEAAEHAEPERSREAPARTIEAPAPTRADSPRSPIERLAGGLGNQGFGRLLARLEEGGGILAGGRVHPDVQAAIAASRGAGQPLDRQVSEHLEPSLGGLEDVRIHTGEGAAALARAVSARAFTVGSDIFFGDGEYRPGSSEGQQLIAHEAAHVAQQRGAPDSGPLIVTQPGDAYEREAEAVARGLGL